MNETITFNKIQTEIIKELPKMSRIRLLTTWMSLSSLEKKFPKNITQIHILAKRIETLITAK